jgi:hypothetical protein
MKCARGVELNRFVFIPVYIILTTTYTRRLGGCSGRGSTRTIGRMLGLGTARLLARILVPANVLRVVVLLAMKDIATETTGDRRSLTGGSVCSTNLRSISSGAVTKNIMMAANLDGDIVRGGWRTEGTKSTNQRIE